MVLAVARGLKSKGWTRVTSLVIVVAFLLVIAAIAAVGVT
jgi:hypothetical protein